MSKIQQFKLSEDERQKLKSLIERHWNQDSTDLNQRSQAFKRWVRLWRASSDDNAFPEQDKSNFHIPLVLWQIMNKVAKEFSLVFGEDAEVIVKPKGDTDAKRADKVRSWMNWRIANLPIQRPYYDFNVMKQIFGTAIAYTPYVTLKRQIKRIVPGIEIEYQERIVGGLKAQVPVEIPTAEERVEEVIDFEGTQLIPENIEDWVVPKAGGPSLEAKDHFIRRLRLTVEEILDLRDQGKIDATIVNKEFVEKLYKQAETEKGTTAQGQDAGKIVRDERDAQAGEPTTPVGSEDRITLYNWVGRFRKENQERPEKLVCFYIPQMSKLVGAVSQVDMWPDGRLPFIKAELIRDPNRFWGIGIPELLESINNEMDSLHNITTDAGLGAVGPMIFYKPMSGFDPVKFKWEPFLAVPVNDPQNDVKVLTLGQVNLSFYGAILAQLLASAERITGLTETQLGRQFSGPNAPRTVGQQSMLQAESNQRLALDLELERDVVRQFLRIVWDNDKRFVNHALFERVTEESGEDVLTQEVMQGEYDFDIGPPTAVSNRATLVQELLQASAMVNADPLGQQLPALKLGMLRKVLEKLHQPELAALVPSPDTIPKSQDPDQENARMLQGETIQISPMDNHAVHITVVDHLLQRIDSWEDQQPGTKNLFDLNGTISRLMVHRSEHEQAMKTKGASIQMGGQQPQGQQMFGAGPNAMQGGMGGPGGQSQSAAAPQASPGAAALASMRNQQGQNNGGQ